MTFPHGHSAMKQCNHCSNCEWLAAKQNKKSTFKLHPDTGYGEGLGQAALSCTSREVEAHKHSANSEKQGGVMHRHGKGREAAEDTCAVLRDCTVAGGVFAGCAPGALFL